MMMARAQAAAAKPGRGCGVFSCIAAFVLGAALIVGCAGKDFEALRPDIVARGVYIEGVPFYRQTESACGPAALAGVFAFWGKPLAVDKIAEKTYLPELRGTLPMDMESFARDAGYNTMSTNGTLTMLKEHIRRGTPVICLLDLGFGPYRQPHYVTAIGFEDAHAVIIVHDGLKPDRLIGYESFDRDWSRAGRWMLVIEPEKTEKKHDW
ncbi:MAG TPA: C39 family peptidase [Nitrospirota bacterium]|nr:C39 family peptidase [Nitrospirota bacterium]